ncbi:MAG: PAS domain S-box protein [Acidobacteriia bacterium]|jgi:two-component system NtrC family sensor kinase|nr:PAS domain S-box protein [Terriglobia bacterium]
MPDQGNLGIVILEASAILILLILYLLLYRNFPERFFRMWVVGWVLYAGFGAGRSLCCVYHHRLEHLATAELLFLASLLFLAAVLEYTGHPLRLRTLGGLALVGGLMVALPSLWQQSEGALPWIRTAVQSSLFLTTGWILWRHVRSRSSFGPVLLSAAFLLRGLHWIDQSLWMSHPLYPVRLALDGLFEVAIGVAMVVVVLEDTRARAEDLNAKLRQLTLITTSGMQTLQIEKVLNEVLQHLVASLNATHGQVRLLEGGDQEPELVLRAATGCSPDFLEQRRRVRASEPWARRVLESSTPIIARPDTPDREVRQWMTAERLCVLALVRLPGQDRTIGLLGIGCHTPRVFRDDELSFLVNVANLLGLTVQNVWLFQHVSEAQRQWANTFDSITDPILVHDNAYRVLRVNRAVGDRLGVDPGTLAGQPMTSILRRGERFWRMCPYCEHAAGKGDTLDPFFGGYLLVSNAEVRDGTGQRAGTIHVLKDVTALYRAEQMYRSLFENVREGVFISTPEGRFVDFNDAFMRILGYEDRDELMNTDIASTLYVRPADRERLKQLLFEHGSVSNYEYQLRRRDGEIIDVSESSIATRDAQGRVVAYQGFVLDITARKQAEQEIRRRNRELMVLNSIAMTLSQSLGLDELLSRALSQLVELFGVDLGAIYLLDEKTLVVQRHAAVGFRSEYATKFPPTPVSAQFIRHLRRTRATVVPAMNLPLPEVFRDLQQKEGIQVSYLIVLWSKDRILGGLVVASRSAREFSAAELNLLSAVGSLVASTVERSLLYEETRRAYEDLRRTQEQLLQSEKMAAVGQLISGVAHELNNPLTAILGYSQLLAGSGEVTERGSQYVEKLYRQAQRTHRIVQNLLSFARQHKPERLPVKINQILEDTLMLREYDLKLNNIRVHRNLDPALPLTSGDAHQLQQVFLNILNNAVDAILERAQLGEIWVETRAENGMLVVEITDSGPGVTDPLRIFDPFYTTKAVGKGTGLGLSICYGIVKEHGGEIRARNSPPRGATFTVSLPVLSAGEQKIRLPEPPRHQVTAGIILLVDDEEAVLDLEQEILRGHFTAVHAVRSGRDALELLAREPVDVVVTDLKMPGEITGREIYAWIERERPELLSRLIFTVSDAGTPDVRAFLERTRCSFVQKPFKMEEFLGLVRQVLTQPAQQPSPITR